MKISEAIYDTLSGNPAEKYRVPGIENMFLPNSECDLLYLEMRQAYDRLLERPGEQDDDTDIEQLLIAQSKINKRVALRMYEIGALIGAVYQPPSI